MSVFPENLEFFRGNGKSPEIRMGKLSITEAFLCSGGFEYEPGKRDFPRFLWKSVKNRIVFMVFFQKKGNEALCSKKPGGKLEFTHADGTNPRETKN